MRFDRDPAAAGPIVQGFSGNGFRVDGAVFRDGVLLAADFAREWVAPPLEALDRGDLADLLDGAPEFLLLGTGATMRRPPARLVAALEAQGIGVEAMDSRAAARAWGLLRGEGRNIVAALLPL